MDSAPRVVEAKPGSFIFVSENALSPTSCAEIIEKFDKDDRKHAGKVGAGSGVLRPEIKSSVDLAISPLYDWLYFDRLLDDSLRSRFEEMRLKFPGLTASSLARGDFQIQKTLPGQGYTWHVDAGGANHSRRQLVVIWYLNDVEEGGATEFEYQDVRVQPKVGRMTFFPPFWTHRHRGATPVSGAKYIVTTWMSYRV